MFLEELFLFLFLFQEGLPLEDLVLSPPLALEDRLLLLPLDLGGSVLKFCVGSKPSIVSLGIGDFNSFSISNSNLCSSALTKDIALPSFPALAVLPIL